MSGAHSTAPRRALEHGFVVTTPSPELTIYLERVFSDLPRCPVGTSHEYDIRAASGDGLWVATVDGQAIGSPGTRAHALGLAFWRINRGAVLDNSQHVTLHAASVDIDGVGVLLPGGMEAGKTTLAAGLLRGGARYLTDELAVVVPGGVTGYAKALSLDRGSWSLFPELASEHPADLSTWLPTQWQIPPCAFGAAVERLSDPGVIVFPNFQPEAPTVRNELRGAEALGRLASCTFPNELPMAETLGRLACLLNGARVHELTFSDLAEAVRAVRDLSRAVGRTPAARRVPVDHQQGVQRPRTGMGAVASNEIEGPRPLLPRDGLNLIWVQDEALLHREDTDELLQLDHLGAELWEMIGCGMSLENLIDVLGGSDEVVRCPIAAKVRAFVEELLHLGLIRLG